MKVLQGRYIEINVTLDDIKELAIKKLTTHPDWQEGWEVPDKDTCEIVVLDGMNGKKFAGNGLNFTWDERIKGTPDGPAEHDG